MIFIVVIFRRVNMKKRPQVMMNLKMHLLLHLMDMRTFMFPLHEDNGFVSCTHSKFLNFIMPLLMIWKRKSLWRNPWIWSISLLDKECDHESENIDDFLHIGRHKWDMGFFHFDGNPIYDTDDYSRVKSAKLFPLEQPSFSLNFHDQFQPYMYINDADFWQHKEDMFIGLFQPPKDDLL
jgi:hypothetical protein